MKEFFGKIKSFFSVKTNRIIFYVTACSVCPVSGLVISFVVYYGDPIIKV